jgi:cell division septation protein DedD
MRNKNEEGAAAKPADVIKELAPEKLKKINDVVDKPATADKVKTEDTLDNQTSDTDVKGTGDKGSRKQIIRDIHNELLEMERARKKRIRFYIPVTVIAAFVLTLALYSLNKEPRTDFNKPVPDVPKSVSSQTIEKKQAENTGIVQANKSLKETVPDIPKPAPPKAAKKRPPQKTRNAQISKSLKKPVLASKPSTRRVIGKKRLNNSGNAPTANTGYFIQVGAWKNVKYARSILIRLKKNYPEAYIAVENNYNKIRIPDIKSRKHGAVILRNIEKKFRLKPVLFHSKT